MVQTSMRIDKGQKGKNLLKRVPIGTLNIPGLSGNAEAVEKLMSTHKLKLLAITDIVAPPRPSTLSL